MMPAKVFSYTAEFYTLIFVPQKESSLESTLNQIQEDYSVAFQNQNLI